MPQGRAVRNVDEAWQTAQEMGLPVVVKPQFGNQGDGVVIGISTREQIDTAFHFATPFGGDVIIEELARGAEHRLLVVAERWWRQFAATRRSSWAMAGRPSGS